MVELRAAVIELPNFCDLEVDKVNNWVFIYMFLEEEGQVFTWAKTGV